MDKILHFSALPYEECISISLFGRPEAQPRPGYRNQWYNPKAAKIVALRGRLKELLSNVQDNDNGPLYKEGDWLIVEFGFFYPRPRRQMKKSLGVFYLPAVIRNCFERAFVSRVVDIDNLSKIYMDAMSGCVYYDDFQVVKLVATKLNDNNDDCCGRTTIKVKKVKNLNKLLI